MSKRKFKQKLCFVQKGTVHNVTVQQVITELLKCFYPWPAKCYQQLKLTSLACCRFNEHNKVVLSLLTFRGSASCH